MRKTVHGPHSGVIWVQRLEGTFHSGQHPRHGCLSYHLRLRFGSLHHDLHVCFRGRGPIFAVDCHRWCCLVSYVPIHGEFGVCQRFSMSETPSGFPQYDSAIKQNCRPRKARYHMECALYVQSCRKRRSRMA